MTGANPSRPHRRRLLRWAALAGGAAIAGCLGGDGDDSMAGFTAVAAALALLALVLARANRRR